MSWFFQNFLRFLCSVLRVSPETDSKRRDRSILVPAELAAETRLWTMLYHPIGFIMLPLFGARRFTHLKVVHLIWSTTLCFVMFSSEVLLLWMLAISSLCFIILWVSEITYAFFASSWKDESLSFLCGDNKSLSVCGVASSCIHIGSNLKSYESLSFLCGDNKSLSAELHHLAST